MDKTKVNRYLNSIGKRTFVNCFELFKDNYDKCNEIELGKMIPLHDPLSESNNPDSSLRRKASYAIGLFRNGCGFDALKICAEATRIDHNINKLP